ncbi:MAG: DUF3164 family protein [Culturomica sp.]|nr:DUF3164 family protein [Culturomica sp.]
MLASEKAKQARQEEERRTYKELSGAVVDDLFPLLEETSRSLVAAKKKVYVAFAAALEMKRGLYDVATDQATHTFINAAHTRRITLGIYMVDSYDNTANEGVAIVKEYISALAKDEDSRMLVKTVLKLLAKDKKGNLKPSRIILLRQLANERGDERFIEGVRVIENAYKPEPSKTFVKAEYKDELGAWKVIALGMTEA